VFQYEPGPLRDYFRSTAAHSTLVVDGENQTQMASSFRVGRLASASLLPEQTERLPLIVRGVHDGYARLRQPVSHRRTLVLHNPRKLTLQDEIEGRGDHDLDLTFHLAPCRGVSVERGAFVASYDEGLTMRLSFEAPLSAERVVDEGWYSPTWYTREPTPVLHLRWRGKAPSRIATTITITQEVA
jgi:hypothetical protein